MMTGLCLRARSITFDSDRSSSAAISWMAALIAGSTFEAINCLTVHSAPCSLFCSVFAIAEMNLQHNVNIVNNKIHRKQCYE